MATPGVLLIGDVRKPPGEDVGESSRFSPYLGALDALSCGSPDLEPFADLVPSLFPYPCGHVQIEVGTRE